MMTSLRNLSNCPCKDLIKICDHVLGGTRDFRGVLCRQPVFYKEIPNINHLYLFLWRSDCPDVRYFLRLRNLGVRGNFYVWFYIHMLFMICVVMCGNVNVFFLYNSTILLTEHRQPIRGIRSYLL